MHDSDYKFEDDTLITRIDDIMSIKTGFNMILVKTILDTRKSGSIHIQSFDKSESSNRIVEVIKVPTVFGCIGDGVQDKHLETIRWSTEMQLQVGDIAWVSPEAVIIDNNIDSKVYICDGERYFLVNYAKFIVAKRPFNPLYSGFDFGEDIICLNGYILIKELFETQGFQSFSKEVPTGFGEVIHSGRPNDYYDIDSYSDCINIHPGIYVELPKHIIRLEDSKYLQFDGKTNFIICQRKNIDCSSKNKNMSLQDINISPAQLYVEPITNETTSGGIIIPISAERGNIGIVRKIGAGINLSDYKGLEIGSEVSYSIHSKEIDFEGKTYRKVPVNSLDWWKTPTVKEEV